MKVIQPNCRVQFTAADLDFIVATLARTGGQGDCLVKLLTDAESRDLILDDDALYHALLEQRSCLRVSTRLYFYVLVRQTFRQVGIEDRSVADYVAEMLTEFSRSEQTRGPGPGQTYPLDYFFEILATLQNADKLTSFVLRAHIGNHSLFLSGLFSEHIRYRAEYRGSPDLRYYEELGRMNFRAARDHRMARQYELAPIFATLADRFQTTRLALNDLSERLFSLGDPDLPLNALLN